MDNQPTTPEISVYEILEKMHLKGRKNPNGYGEALDEATEAIEQLLIEARIDELETPGSDILLAHTVGEEHAVRDNRSIELKNQLTNKDK